MALTDTIVAIATPPGRGGIGVVRVSGPLVPAIAAGMLGSLPRARVAQLAEFRGAGGEMLDAGLALYFEAPRSFTGEHVLELHGHGGPVVQDRLVARVLEFGARAARPGEFSERAFLNDKLDLVQAEAVADLIDAGSVAAARAALRSLQGEFSVRVDSLATELLGLRVHVEATIDFVDEDIELLEEGAIGRRLIEWLAASTALGRMAEQGRLLREGCTVVIAGRPNAGKSTLMNALSGEDIAIVTAIPGTTRDVLRAAIDLDGLPVTLLDTAGLRESADAIEQEGIRRARREIERADRVLYLVDASDADCVAAFPDEIASLPADLPVTVVLNKSDRAEAMQRVPVVTAPDCLRIAASTGWGLDALRLHLKECLGYRPDEASVFSARRRHLAALERAHTHVLAAEQALRSHHGVEIVAEELKLAHTALGEITGTVTPEDLLGEIFASFCIGK
jgi:tRNA modification GTPase